MPQDLLLLRPGETEIAAPAAGGHKDKLSPGHFDIFAHHGEPHTAAFHLVAGFQGLEHLENLVVELRRDAGAIVLDRKGVEIPVIEVYEVYFAGNLLTVAYKVKCVENLSWERFTAMQDGNGEAYLN